MFLIIPSIWYLPYFSLDIHLFHFCIVQGQLILLCFIITLWVVFWIGYASFNLSQTLTIKGELASFEWDALLLLILLRSTSIKELG